MISISNLALSYGDFKVVEGFSAEISAGTITAITGLNGAGKSTLLHAIAGDHKIAAGTIELKGLNISTYSLSQLAELRSVASQSHFYWLAYSAREVIGIATKGISQKRIDGFISELGVDEFINQPITELSGGQLQRVALIQALARDTALVLLDEPLASQDFQSRDEIRRVLCRERDNGRTIVLVIHADDKDLEWCDQIINLDE